jgi:peptidyl-tRNA hydrolase, PTH1 family
VKVIAGLGNPGVQYQRNRHNIGFLVVDRLAETHHISISHKRFHSLYGTGTIDSEKVVLVKPLTFMNRSGDSLQRVLHFFNIDVENLIVIHDDLDLAYGRLRFKKRGGDGGHQGIRSIIESIGRNDFLRLKVGIGRPPVNIEPAEYVLSNFDRAERSELEGVVSRAAESLSVALLEGVEVAMNRYQKRSPVPTEPPRSPDDADFPGR